MPSRYEPGAFFRQMMSQRRQERLREQEMAAQWSRYYDQQAKIEQRTREQRVWEEHKGNAQLFVNGYLSANTPAEKELFRQKWKAYRADVPATMRAGIDKLMEGSPLSEQSMLDAEWYKNNPSPAEANFKPEDNPYKWVSMAYTRELHKAKFAKERRGQSYVLPTEYPINDKIYGYVDSAGRPQLGSYEVKNQMFDKLAEGNQMSGYALMMSGGWTKGQMTTVYHSDPVTGEQYQSAYLVQKNVVNGQTRTKKLISGEAKRGKPDRAGAISQPEQNVDELIAYLRTDTEPPEGYLSVVYERIQDRSKDLHDQYESAETKKEKEALISSYETMLNEELRELDNRFVYVLKGEGTEDYRPFFGKNKFRPGKTTRIISVPGEFSSIPTRDGKQLKVIVDFKNNRVYSPDGEFRGTITEATQYFGSYTFDELSRRHNK